VARRRSYDLKLDRAEKHLIEIEEIVREYRAARPYTVAKLREGQRQKTVWRFRYTSQPPEELALISADFIYNVRSALDHLAATLVLSNDRDMFPVFFQGVWEPEIDGENAERRKMRQRWASLTRNMAPDAVALLKQAQPPDRGGDEGENLHSLTVLNRLSNKDRHTKLPVHAGKLLGAQITYRAPDGTWMRGALGDMESLEDDARLPIPHNATNVEASGTVSVGLDYGPEDMSLMIPEGFREITLKDARTIMDAFRPYDRGTP
jgi:hypothetical protein